MISFIIAYIALCVLALAGGQFCTKRRKRFYLLSCGILLFLMCFRDISVGSDTIVYSRYFERFRIRSWEFAFSDVTWEPGFVIIMKLLGYVFEDWRGFVFTMGVVNLVPFMYLVWKWSDNPGMSLVLFLAMLYTAAEYLYRQWLALLILMIACRFVTERKPIHFLATVALAALFHRTALVFAVVYVLYNVKFTILMMLASAAVSVVLMLTGDLWIWLANFVARTELTAGNNGGLTMMVFLWLCAGIIYVFSRHRLKDPWFRLNFVMLMIAVVTQPICFTFSLWSRIVLYFRVSLVFLLPITVQDVVETVTGNATGALAHPWVDKAVTAAKNRHPRLYAWMAPQLPVLAETVFYTALFVYFLANGIHDFVMMPLS